MVKRRRHAARLEHDPPTAWRLGQGLRDRIRQGRCHCLQHNLALAVDNADVRLFHRDIQSSKVFHGCSPFALGSQSYRTPEEQPPHYPMLQKSDVDASDETMESELRMQRIEVALLQPSAIQSCAPRPPKYFCNSICQIQTS